MNVSNAPVSSINLIPLPVVSLYQMRTKHKKQVAIAILGVS